MDSELPTCECLYAFRNGWCHHILASSAQYSLKLHPALPTLALMQSRGKPGASRGGRPRNSGPALSMD
ncbi:hypothetical protein BCR44DRAFT_1427101 [Catenaria anguillulae PL171]|uniref:SWIM-type domain-containing protein n=1 Tax=Catenaria anguillulae PL171 TaxID=765915 RepID=A0A1Y2HZA1_9FUNG|nr:hypothetical protein BCR44DRAFT_1427101 [Catenaria anguillulae PL171]